MDTGAEILQRLCIGIRLFMERSRSHARVGVTRIAMKNSSTWLRGFSSAERVGDESRVTVNNPDSGTLIEPADTSGQNLLFVERHHWQAPGCSLYPAPHTPCYTVPQAWEGA